MYYFVLVLDKFKGLTTEKNSSLSSKDEGKALYPPLTSFLPDDDLQGVRGEVIMAEFQMFFLCVILMDSPAWPAAEPQPTFSLESCLLPMCVPF